MQLNESGRFWYEFLIMLDWLFLSTLLPFYYAIRCICGILIVVFSSLLFTIRFILFLSCRLQSKVKKRCAKWSDLTFTTTTTKITTIKQNKTHTKNWEKWVQQLIHVEHGCALTVGIWHIYSMSMKNVQNLLDEKEKKDTLSLYGDASGHN